MNPISLKGKALLFALALAALPAGMTSRASAAVFQTVSVTPTSILEGETVTLHLHLDLLAAASGSNPFFFGGSVEFLPFFPFFATATTFDIGLGGTTRDFSATYVATTAGAYTPKFTSTSAWFETIVTDAGPQLVFHNSFTSEDLGLLNVSVAATPVPAALPLFGTGLGLMGFVGWWRKRRAGAVA